jgi:peptidoglycan hydrolase-like protein with peptidoglycan-binding domain
MLKKLKAFKFLIATFAVAGALIGASAFAAYDFGSYTLKVGSKGEAVKNVQIVVGATPVDGAFGPITKAKVMAWQANNGLVADGFFGPMSKAKANEVSGSYPNGCTSAVGYSSTTGVKCDGVTVVTPTPILNGGAGDASATSTSTDIEKVVKEGTDNVKVLGFKIEAVDSDVVVTSLKVSLSNVATGSTRLDRYMGVVSIYTNGVKVGTANVADFSRDGIVYSKSISLNGAIVKEGTSNKGTFYVVVSANDSIDSVNMERAEWGVEVGNIRFQDAAGVTMTNNQTIGSLTVNKFTFTSLANSGDVKLTISKDSISPPEATIEVSDTNTTSNVKLLVFKLKAAGTDMTFDTVTVDLTATGATTSQILDELILKNGSDEIAIVDTFGASSATFNLDSTFTINADSTEAFTVVARIKKICTSSTCTTTPASYFTQGDSLKASLGVSGIEVEDENGDVVTNEAGSASGSDQTFYVNGAMVSFISGNYTAYTVDNGYGLVSIKFNVKAFDDNDVVFEDNVFTAGNIEYTLSGAINTAGLITSTDSTVDGHTFTVTAGDDATFTLTSRFTAAPSGFVTLEINKVDGTSVSNVKTVAY